MGKNLVKGRILPVVFLLIILAKPEPSSATDRGKGLEVRPLTSGFQTSGNTVFVLTNTTDLAVSITYPGVRADAEDALLYPPDRPSPAFSKPTEIPAQGTAIQIVPTHLLPVGLKAVAFDWFESSPSARREPMVSLELAPSPEELRLPGGSVAFDCAGAPKASRRLVPGFTSVTLHEVVGGERGAAGVFQYTTANCGASDALLPTDFPVRFSPVQWVKDTVLSFNGVDLVIPGGKVAPGAESLIGLWKKSGGPRTVTFRINGTVHRVRLPPSGGTLSWVSWPSKGPHRLSLGKENAEVSLFGAPLAPQLQVPCGIGIGRQRLSTSGWVETSDFASRSVYRVTGGAPLRIMGYALGPC